MSGFRSVLSIPNKLQAVSRNHQDVAKKKIAQGIDKINAVKFNRRTVLIRFHDLDQIYI